MLDSHPITDAVGLLDVVPLAVAIVVGGLIGFEREFHGRPAGLRTHILVCLTSATLISAARHIPSDLVEHQELIKIVMDPNRLSAGIMTGIGFLGAASVIRAGDMVRGITTGATVWCVAGLGVVVGQGAYTQALLASGFVLIVLAGFDQISRQIAPVIYRRLIVRGVRSELPALAGTVADILANHDIRVQDLSGRRSRDDEPFELVFHIRCRNAMQAPEMLELIAAQRGVLSVDWSQISH
jgi:putative Mg2+ transporter-C (MgtC) family protein